MTGVQLACGSAPCHSCPLRHLPLTRQVSNPRKERAGPVPTVSPLDCAAPLAQRPLPTTALPDALKSEGLLSKLALRLLTCEELAFFSPLMRHRKLIRASLGLIMHHSSDHRLIGGKKEGTDGELLRHKRPRLPLSRRASWFPSTNAVPSVFCATADDQPCDKGRPSICPLCARTRPLFCRTSGAGRACFLPPALGWLCPSSPLHTFPCSASWTRSLSCAELLCQLAHRVDCDLDGRRVGQGK